MDLSQSRSTNISAFICLILFLISISVTWYDTKWVTQFVSRRYSLLIVNSTIRTKFDSRRYPSPIVNGTIQTQNSSDDYLRVEFNVSSIIPTCQNDDVLLLYILSTSKNFDRRENIRSTWGSKLSGTCFVFIVGNTEINSTLQSKLNIEQEKHRDLVQINHIESYANVIYKEVAALLWSEQYYGTISYLFKTDDDLIVDSILLTSIARFLVTNRSESIKYISKHRHELVEELTQSNRKNFFRGGWDMGGQPTQRGDGKFAVSEKIWPDKILPPYCSGFGWLMSASIRDKLVRASRIYPREKIVWVGDVFLSGFIARAANVRCSGIPIDYEQVGEGKCACSFVKQPMLVVCSSALHIGALVEGDPTGFHEFNNSWTVIRRRHGLLDGISGTIEKC